MATDKKTVWQQAQSCGVDDFISKVSSAFGKDAISGVLVANEGGVFTTDDRMIILLDNRRLVSPGARTTAAENKKIRSSKKPR